MLCKCKAYIPRRSTINNTCCHIGKEWVIKIDLKNFFVSISSKHIFNILFEIGYTIPVVTLLTKLATLNGHLPQGAPTSGYLSNLALKDFDKLVFRYCNTHNIFYTRYADDMTFSGDKINIKKLIEFVKVELDTQNVIWGSKLKINRKKIKIMNKGSRQISTGIKLNTPREYRMKIRQEIHFIKKFGIDNSAKHIKRAPKDYVCELLSKIRYAVHINKNDLQMSESYNFLSQLLLK